MRKPRKGFWFASVGGAATEVVRIHEGQMFSTGCADGHSLEGVELIERIEFLPPPKAEREANIKKWEARRERERARGVWHNYRSFK